MRLHLLTTDISAFQLLDALEGSVEASCVIIPANRLHVPKIKAVQAEAMTRGIPVSVHALRSAFELDLPPADSAVSWLYSQIIRYEDVARYPRGTLNMHGGRIPEYRGANVLQWAIINGERELGITWHEMVEEVDAGTIWAEEDVPIAPEATAWDVRERMIAKGIALFPLAWRNMALNREGRVPDLSRGKVWPVRHAVDGLIAPGLTEREVRDLVRALCPPWPPAFVETDDGRYPVAEVLSSDAIGSLSYVTAEGRQIFLRRAPEMFS